MRQVILESNQVQKRVAILNNGRVTAFFKKLQGTNFQAGELFLSRVETVAPHLDGCFVSLPLGEKGFLPKSEWPSMNGNANEQIQAGETLIVQMKHEAQETKKALMTRNVQIKGDSLIYLPFGNYVAASHRLDEEARIRLKDLMASVIESPEGLICRTASDHQSKQALLEELRVLRQTWGEIKKETDLANVPSRLRTEPFFSLEIMSILPSNEEREWVTNDQTEADRLEQSGESVLFRQTEDLFEGFGLKSEWEHLHSPKVYLKSGITLVIEHTEALTAIDVNTFTYKKFDSKEENAYQANLEAVVEIARQLSLRQIGGLIVIDLLKMEDPAHKADVQKRFDEALREDLMTTHLAGYTKLGLMELTRKKGRFSPLLRDI